MQSRREIGNRKPATRQRTVSLDEVNVEVIDLKLIEAIERLERVQSKALSALGAMFKASA